jgi:peptidoglycan hydrolase-like protein with peptidoglycan-binding domain
MARSTPRQEGEGSLLTRAGIVLGVALLVLLPVIFTIPALNEDSTPTSAGSPLPSPPAPPSPEPSPSPAPAPSPVPSPVPAAPNPAPLITNPSLYPKVGSSGPDVLAMEDRLGALSYLVGPVDGVFDKATSHGVMAFQKAEGLQPTGVADASTMIRLQSATKPKPAYVQPYQHLEVDIKRQVVFLVRNGEVVQTLSTSTGNNKKFTSEGRTRRAFTPNGTFTVAYKRQGWRKSPLGLLYRPAYFNGGIAFHGAPSVPATPASHGCVRLPMPFADWFAEVASPVGTTVHVYGGPVGENPAPDFVDAPAPAPAPGAGTDPAPAPAPEPTPSPSPSPSPQGLLPGILSPPTSTP